MKSVWNLAAFALVLISAASTSWSAEALTATAVIHGDQDGGKISRHIYGHFTEHLGRCIYDGIWAGKESKIPNTRGIRNDVIEALKATKVPNLRWPGGCFADDYHWRDGIGPAEQRPKTVNMHWGQVVETNAFGTHEFLDLCELTGADAYIAGNMGSGSPNEMRDWLEYMTYDGDSTLANLRRKNGRDKPWRIPFFGVGNENWGCGGNMTAEFYSDQYRRRSAPNSAATSSRAWRAGRAGSISNGRRPSWIASAPRCRRCRSTSTQSFPTGRTRRARPASARRNGSLC
jgi:alpha-N-arabinofuranosidase